MLCACRSPAADPPPVDEDHGATTGSTSGTGDAESETTFSAPPSCGLSRECEKTVAPFCVAPYDPGSGTIEDATCVTECVSVGDLARACRDDAGCCEGLLCNEVDGFCAPEAVASTSSSGADTETDTDTDASSTSGSSASTGASTGDEPER